ncbi:acetylgalactosaminyl-O-glycosyl-glycoprotein beta-1,3-N-acetylglucosaminyltransferase isoform X2 [Meles meles]|uniref:acetylgalactosaminyl-O-glycosyl-glycoprotein beta-1,3-N-acetylglucosaminyltransferase isoform X2 n=1 Tax=Meles meles TaxID=9662 RepID=UPI001E69B429|nr:acetylgalactosaminyl-O-glycosyl-glycoprotein beta-1,3-N-acetylglucosaminyltransferase isoform X2 [Meles meles]
MSPRTPPTADVLCFLQKLQPGRPLLAARLLARSVPVREGCSKSFAPPRLYPGQAYLLPSPARGRPPQPALPHPDAYRGTCLKRASAAPGSPPSTPACRELRPVHRCAPYEMLLTWKALREPGEPAGPAPALSPWGQWGKAV